MDSLKKRMLRRQFTLVELLVVVAIIAVIGSGIAMTYQNLDDHAKTAMEMSDISALKKSMKHWSAVNDYKLPDGLDSLVDEDGELYTQVQYTSLAGPASFDAADDNGLGGPLGYGTATVAEAPDVVLGNLAAAGMDTVYTHLRGSKIANDSTFETGMMGGDVDTSKTMTTMVKGDSEARSDAQTIVDGDADAQAFDFDSDNNGTPGEASDDDYTVGGQSFNTLADYEAERDRQQAILDAKTTDKLAFIWPGGGCRGMMGASAPMNLCNEIITNIGLQTSNVLDPTTFDPSADAGKDKYFLVAMGLGRFASIYNGRAVRADSPASSKRQKQSPSTYARYVALVRVPSLSYDTMTGSSEAPVIVDVLSPEGYSVAALRDKFQDDKDKIQD